jgi:hypothetical protein
MRRLIPLNHLGAHSASRLSRPRDIVHQVGRSGGRVRSAIKGASHNQLESSTRSAGRMRCHRGGEERRKQGRIPLQLRPKAEFGLQLGLKDPNLMVDVRGRLVRCAGEEGLYNIGKDGGRAVTVPLAVTLPAAASAPSQ